MGLRVPFGMSVVIPDNPVELFLEVAPDVGSYHYTGDTTDHSVLYVDGTFGVRYYF